VSLRATLVARGRRAFSVVLGAGFILVRSLRLAQMDIIVRWPLRRRTPSSSGESGLLGCTFSFPSFFLHSIFFVDPLTSTLDFDDYMTFLDSHFNNLVSIFIQRPPFYIIYGIGCFSSLDGARPICRCKRPESGHHKGAGFMTSAFIPGSDRRFQCCKCDTTSILEQDVATVILDVGEKGAILHRAQMYRAHSVYLHLR
jgi:hypothetical protein